jgi:3-phosphoshikimate 1-carboxyvinyltransferase
MSAMTPHYPTRLAVEPLGRPPTATVRVPGSKSITNRALVLAALCSRVRQPRLYGCLCSEDTEVMIAALRQLGFVVQTDWHAVDPVVTVFRGDRPLIPATSADLYVANSGTTMRFLTAMVGLGHGRYRLDGVPRMRERPIEDLLAALRQLGVDARSEKGNGCPPVVVEANGMKGGRVSIRGDVSSQFLSALLMAAPFAGGDVVIEVQGPLVSRPYVNMTIHQMRTWQLMVSETGVNTFSIPGNQRPDRHRFSEHTIEPDASAASYFWAAAAITGGAVRVAGDFARRALGNEKDYATYLTRPTIQGDVHFVDLLVRMGCTVRHEQEGILVQGAPLHGIDADMNDISDTVMTLAAVACFARGPTTIRNVAHIRHKETDRLAALAAELRRVGAGIEEFADGLTITPRPLHGAEIETYNDHRMAMALALVGLRVPGIVIKDPGCVAKTYPGFFADLERLRC